MSAESTGYGLFRFTASGSSGTIDISELNFASADDFTCYVEVGDVYLTAKNAASLVFWGGASPTETDGVIVVIPLKPITHP